MLFNTTFVRDFKLLPHVITGKESSGKYVLHFIFVREYRHIIVVNDMGYS
jgi:hypothetical protein